MNDADFVGGLYPKPKAPAAPDFVIGKLSINIAQFREWMKDHIKAHPGEDWLNIDLKVSKAGKGYAVVDDWKPESGPAGKPDPSEDDFDVPY
jgi:hypothetical protein